MKKSIFKQTNWISFFVLIVLLVFNACSKEETSPRENENLFCEQAYPNMTGDTVNILLEGEEVTCEFINGEYVYQGDIILTPEPLKSTEGAGLKSLYKRWPNNTVFYRIHNNFPNTNRVTDAIHHWESNTNLHFVQVTNESNYIEFVKGDFVDQGSSELGMIGGRQKIRIGDILEVGEVIHEIGHAIGLIHEQCKKNRDEYIIINWENIENKKKHNFRKMSNSIITDGFDFNSIMLYESWAFSKNNKETMTKLDGTWFAPQRDYLTEKDIMMVSIMYPNGQNGKKILVLFDGDPSNWTEPNVPGSHSIEISNWEGAGYSIEKANLTNTTFTLSLLQGFSVMRIGMYNPREISTSEGNAISQWVSNGGKLLIDMPYQKGINAIKEFGVNEIIGEGGGTYGLTWAYHGAPLVIGPVSGPTGTVNSIGIEAMDQPILKSGHNLTIAATYDGYPAIVYKTYGAGKVVILFDGGGWSLDVVHPGNAYRACISNESNLEFLQNIIQYFN